MHGLRSEEPAAVGSALWRRGGQGQACWGVRGSCGLAFSQSFQILHILAIQFISCFHNLGLDLYICDLYIMLIIERYEINGVIQITKKRKILVRRFIGFGANCLYLFRKGQVSVYLKWHSALICIGNDRKTLEFP